MTKPYAVFIGHQENVAGKSPVALYNIIGGPKNGFTVSAKTLKEEGIEIPRGGDSERKELRKYLDEKISGWHKMSSLELDRQVRRRWKAGEFKKLITAVLADSGKAVKVGGGYYSYVEY